MAEKCKGMTSDECRQKAAECRAMARGMNSEHRIMLDHIADTWDRIASDVEKRNGAEH